jgi:hypothetical protein
MSAQVESKRSENVSYILGLLDLNVEANKKQIFGEDAELNIKGFFASYDDGELELVVDDIKGDQKIQGIISGMKNEDGKIKMQIDKITQDPVYSDMKPVLDKLTKELYELQLKTILIKCQKISKIVPTNNGKELFMDLTNLLSEKLRLLNELQDSKHTFYNHKVDVDAAPTLPDVSASALPASVALSTMPVSASALPAASPAYASALPAASPASASALPSALDSPASDDGSSAFSATSAAGPTQLPPALPQAGGGEDWDKKYMKYKLKYMQLKNKMF